MNGARGAATPRRWQNWARTESSDPALVLAPRSTDQVALAVRRAGETGHTVKAVGASHSFTSIAATDGVQLSMDRMRGLVSADPQRGRVTLRGGTRLWELPALLGPLGLALPNMGDIDRQSITGATQTGTHGTGLKFGGIATGIVGLELVTGTGDTIRIDADNYPELLPAAALGLGALGIVTEVTLQCVPRFLLQADEAPDQLDIVLAEFVERSRAADHFEFFWFPHTDTVRTKTNTRLPLDHGRAPLGKLSRFVDEELANNLAFGACVNLGAVTPRATPAVNRFVETLSSRRRYTDESHSVFVTHRRVHFREMEYAVPLEEVADTMRELRAMIERKRYSVSFPIEVRAAGADNLLLSTAHGRDSGYIAVHRYHRDRDLGYFRDAEAILAAHGGRPHWGKMHTLGAAELRERYPEFDRFATVRENLDPERVFRNDYLDRVLSI
ncbi:D-arabinono-1,4-lactone oxidase [Leucobacter sp. 7(1)]|uniref:D-arabinono-1,4-lactone oxidase n=1 Tax=Leucobacter sp. 7(1) TaxID=1255613 RepID=UPI000B35CFC8|nr:D-arabinono-1,4-lactone oxidase [Leucobacter sp. 7(1)]